MSHGERDDLRNRMRERRTSLAPGERIAAARGVGEQLETLLASEEVPSWL